MKLTAVHHQRPALVPEEQTAPARCLGSLYPAQKRLRKNGLSERRRVPRGDSDGRTAERCPQWATLAGLSSRIQLLDAQTQSARPAGVSAHTQQGVQAFAAGRRSRRAAPSDGALTSRIRIPKASPAPSPHRDATTQVLALAPLALGFAPAAQTRAPTALNGYVPKGLTEAQYKAQLAAEKSKAQSNKSKFPKGKKTLDIADWLVQMEKKQTLKGDKVVGSGHSYAKQKFSTKSAFDKVFGTNKEMWE